jgi:hypothetical protein
VSGLLDKVEEALGEGLIGDGPGGASIFGHCCVVVGNSNTRSLRNGSLGGSRPYNCNGKINEM